VSGPFQQAIEPLANLPGFNQRAAQKVVGGIGCTMEQFPSADHLTS
jgi:hypothetical protein